MAFGNKLHLHDQLQSHRMFKTNRPKLSKLQLQRFNFVKTSKKNYLEKWLLLRRNHEKSGELFM